jgi:phage tail tape measure protein, TP901 family, core region
MKAEISSFKRDMAVAASSARKAAKEVEDSGVKARSGIGKLGEVAKSHEKAWDQASSALVGGGAAIVGGLGLATKAAMDWESAWTGVKKTVNGSDDQLAKVEDGLRGLAKTLPSTHAEIAGVAEAAGQLGVATGDVVGFTKTMIDLGESTNLTAEDAATNIAQISNVMGTMKREGVLGVQKFGSALVALGNDGASTEVEILNMAQRIAGAGATIGASESDVLALSNTLASMGVRAEMGGGVTTRVMLKMYSAVQEGGDKLQAFAKVAGTSAEEFGQKFKDDPIRAMDLVNKGLKRVQDGGGNVVATMKELGIKGTEETQVMLQLAASGDLLSDSLNLGSQAWDQNLALAKEAEQRYATAESKVKIAWNNIKDSAIDAGSVLLPMVSQIAEGAATLGGAFGALPAPVQGAVVGLAGVAGVAALAVGGTMKLAKGALDTVSGLRALSGEFPKTISGLGKLAKAAGYAAAIAGVGIAIAKIAEANYMDDIDTGMGRVALAIAKVAAGAPDASQAIDDLFKDRNGGNLTGDVEDLESAIDRTFNKSAGEKFNDWAEKGINAVTGIKGSSQILGDTWGRIDQQLADMVNSGNTEDATKSFEAISEKAKEQRVSVEQLKTLFPGYKDALDGAAASSEDLGTKAEGAAGSLDELGASGDDASAASKEVADALEKVGLAADGTVTSLSAYLDALVSSGLATMSSREASFKWAESLRNTSKEVDEIAKSQGKLGAVLAKGKDDFNRNTDSGLAGLQLFQGKLQEGIQVAQTYAADSTKSQGDVVKQLQSTYDAAVKVGTGFGMSKTAAEGLARETLHIPKDVSIKTWFDETAKGMANDLTGALDAMPDRKDIKVFVSDDGTVNLTQAQIDAIMGQTVLTEVTDAGTVLHVQGKINGVTDGDARLLVRDDGTVSIVQGKINGVKDGSATVKVGETGISAVQAAINSITGRSVNVTVKQKVEQQLVPFHQPARFFDKLGGGANGGRVGNLPRRAGGGRLPTTGLGEDMILGVNGAGMPLARVNDREWVINQKSSDKHDGLLGMINRDDPRLESMKGLMGLASGGRVSASSRASGEAQALQSDVASLKSYLRGEKAQEKAAQRSYDRIDGKKENKGAKSAAKRRLNAAKADVKRTEAQIDRAQKALQDTKAKAGRLSEEQFDLARDLKRGSITESFTSGSGMSVVDRLFEQSKNKDLSKGQRSALRSTAYKMESELLKLEKRSDSLAASLEKATKKRDDLLSVRDSVAGGLRGEYSLESALSRHYEYSTAPATAKGLASQATAQASKIKAFASKLDKLRKKGYPSAIIQEVAELGTLKGGAAADVLLAGTASDVKAFQKAYKNIDKYSNTAGQYVTESMYKGGLDAAAGLVNGLLSKEKDVESATYKLGKAAERGFQKALDIHSPSRVMMQAGIHTGEGAELGILAKVSDVQKAMGQLTEVPGATSWGTPAASVAAQSQIAPTVNLTAVVENPWTGEQIEAKVRTVANHSVPAAANKLIRRNDFGGVHKGRY